MDEKNVVNELVTTLHNAGQIIPRAGDLVAIYDESMGLINAPGMITEIERFLDKPAENAVSIDTKFQDEDELVGNIITATNTVLNHQDIYTRSSILNYDGTLDPFALQQSLDNPNIDFSIIGGQGKSVLDYSGFAIQDTQNPNFKMKLTGGGLYSSGDAGENWDPIVTEQGINASRIAAGTIDTNRVSIMDGSSRKIILNNNGLVVKNDPELGYEIGGNWDNVKAFIGVDNTVGKEGQVFVDGMIKATQGSEIAGWSIGNDKIYKEDTGTYVSLSSQPNDFAFAAGISSNPNDYKFTVTHDGDVTVGGGNVILNSSGLQIQGDSGYIMNSNGIYTNLVFNSTAAFEAFDIVIGTNVGRGSSSQYGCLGMLVQDDWGHTSDGRYAPLYIYAQIPSNFVVTDARVHLYHYPGWYELATENEYYAGWGRARSVRLFKSSFTGTSNQAFSYTVFNSGDYYYNHPAGSAAKTLVPGYTWNTSGTSIWTATAPTGSPGSSLNAPYQEVITSNISGQIVAGQTNVFVVQSTEDIPVLRFPQGDYVRQNYLGVTSSTVVSAPLTWCAQRSGNACARLVVMGYFKP